VSKDAVVLIHGLWMNGVDMSLLKHRLSKYFITYQFSYNSTACDSIENADKLNEFVSKIEANTIHFVAHSLGGLVLRHLFSLHPSQQPGRVVTLGTPHKYSHSASQLSKFASTRFLLGKSIQNGLMGEVPKWNETRELASIAGNFRFGMGVIIPGLVQPNDGTVAVIETLMERMSVHMVFHVSHFGLLLSSKVSDAVVSFLQTGKC
jgi:pimeloyl-ACP methyl ester carboxylesterase